jgi:anaerobic selenocysteine-containing dehydrogenase
MPKASTTRQSAELKTLQPRNSLFEDELASWLWLYELFDTEDQAINGIVRMYLLRHPECNPSGFDYYPADYPSHLTTTDHHKHYNTWYQVRSVFHLESAVCLHHRLSV